MYQTTIDIEPKWIDLTEEFIGELEYRSIEVNSMLRYEDLRQMANCCDRVRQAQKQGKKWLRL